MRVLRWAGRIWTGVLLATVLLATALLGLRLLLPLVSAPPSLLDASPPNGAGDVSPRTSLTLRFSGPMNPRSVERAIQIAPPVPWAPIWDAERTTLTISPSVILRPDSTYRLTLATTALSRHFRAIEQPIALSFRTAPAPAVVRVLPADGAADVPPTTPISIKFSRTIVPTAALLLPAALPELRFDPPVAGSVTWVDQTTALFRPAAPLRPGTRYHATLAPELADIAGVQLGRAFSWSFSTPAPAVLAVSPPDGARLVAPRATLAITISQPLELDSVRASLLISPTTAGELSAAPTPGGGQAITFAPSEGWRPGTTYTAALRAGAAASAGGLPLAAEMRWSFTTAPRPALTGRFPGEGQTLPAGQDIRLIFNTPMDGPALRGALQLTPPADAIRVTARDAEIRITADLRAATTYTLTLPAELADRNGIPLGQAYRIRFVTAPAAPALELPEATAHVVQITPGGPAILHTVRTNLSALHLDLYGLDEAVAVRVLGFRAEDWATFQPERYAQPLLRSWIVTLADPLNTPVEAYLPIGIADSAPPPPGAYYLRLRTPEGPRADVLILISRTRLTLQSDVRTTLVWATDLISGTPLGGLPIALYQSGTLAQQGTTGPDGLVAFARAGAAGPDTIALASGAQLGAASSAWAGGVRPAPARYRMFLTTDRAVYLPGDRVGLAGFVRDTIAPSGTLGLPAPGLDVGVSARMVGAASRIYQERLNLTGTGILSASFTLAADAAPGAYTIAAVMNGDSFQAMFDVRLAPNPPLQVGITAPQLITGTLAPLSVTVRTPEGLPVAGATITWTLAAAPAPFPMLGDYRIGDGERPAPVPAGRTGVGRTDADGRLSLAIADAITGTAPLRYRFQVRAAEPGGRDATAESGFLAAPAPAYIGVRLPSRIFAIGKPGAVELLTLTGAGRPAPETAVRVDVYRRTWEQAAGAEPDGAPGASWRPHDTLTISRRVTTDADGAASLPIALGEGGEYHLRASAAGPTTTASLWATAPGFGGWGLQPGGPRLIADRMSYRPGDTATVLLTTPYTQSIALLTLQGSGAITGTVRTIRAGEPLTLTLRPDDAPALRLTALIADQPAGPGATASAPPDIQSTAALPVIDAGQAITVTLAADRATYAPGDTAALTVTTSDATGAGVPADVVLSIASGQDPLRRSVAEAFQTAALPDGGPRPDDESAAVFRPPPSAPSLGVVPPETASTAGVYWNPALRTDGSGVLTLTVKLPSGPADLRALAWAASGARFGQTRAPLIVRQPIALRAEAPAFFRAGDRVELAARVANTSASPQNVQVTLAAAGVELQPGARPTQQIAMAPGQEARASWPALVMDTAGVWLSISARTADAQPLTADIAHPIQPAGPPQITGGGALVEGRFSQTLAIPADQQARGGQIEIAVAPSSTALARDVAQAIAARPDRSTLDEAGLLLMTAAVSDTRPLAQAALERLLAGQRADGRWGWWPGAPPQSFVTAAAMETLAAARDAGLDVPDDAVARGAGALEFALADSKAQADDRAHALYALGLFGRSAESAWRALAGSPAALGAQGLAYLLLAHPAHATPEDDRAMLDRLAALALHDSSQVRWRTPGGAALDGDVDATALALLALARGQSGADLIPPARRWLAAQQSIGGWPSAFASARALAALRATDPPALAAPSIRYTVALNGRALLSRSFGDVLTSTSALRAPLGQLPARAELLATSEGGPVFLSYRIAAAAPAPPAHDDGVTLLREYLDPTTHQPLDLAKLRVGQLVRVRLTVVAAGPQRFVTIEDPLPAGAALIANDDKGGFEYAGLAGDHLTLASADLAAGIYQHHYLLRMVAGGRYAAPPPTARQAGGGALGVGNTATLEIQGR